MEMQGKVALVTGAATGIGRATVLAFVRQGARVVVADVDEAHASETVRLAQHAGGEATFVRCDVSRSPEVAQAVDTAVRAYGRLDYGFNNAGIEGQQLPTAEYPEDTFRRVLDINLVGVWLCMKHELAVMLKQGSGAIVNCASILGTVGFANTAAYTAAKHGVLGLTKVAALEYSALGIRVNAVCPGFIETPMLERGGFSTHVELRQKVEGLHPIHRLGRPEEVAEAVLWLCSPRASFVAGHPLLVDGGYVAQ
jgi:NAD(P)-dependent dehydrogenase (short-subunit alcohol dehydrogenase family)